MGALLIVILVLCGAGALLPLAVGQSRTPAILGCFGALASACCSASVAPHYLQTCRFSATLWSIPSLATLTLSLDQLSALVLFISGLVLLPGSIFAAGRLDRYLGRYSLRAFSVSLLRAFHYARADSAIGRRAVLSDAVGVDVDPDLPAGELRRRSGGTHPRRVPDAGDRRGGNASHRTRIYRPRKQWRARIHGNEDRRRRAERIRAMGGLSARVLRFRREGGTSSRSTSGCRKPTPRHRRRSCLCWLG